MLRRNLSSLGVATPQAPLQPNTSGTTPLGSTGTAAPSIPGNNQDVGSRLSWDDLSCSLPRGSFQTSKLARTALPSGPCTFDAYFFLLCKRRWLNELKKSSNKEVTLQDENVSIDESVQEMTFQTEAFDDKQSLFDEMFQKLGDKCQEVLKLSFVIKTMEEVAEKLNVTYGYVRKKKSLCTGQLTEMIQQSNRYKSLKY